VIARQVRLTLRDQDINLPPETERLTEIIAIQITRQAGRRPLPPLQNPRPNRRHPRRAGARSSAQAHRARSHRAPSPQPRAP
jgi:hypothetical protein